MAGTYFIETCEGHKFWLIKSAIIGVATNINKPESILILINGSVEEGGFPLEFKNKEERDEKLVELLEWLS